MLTLGGTASVEASTMTRSARGSWTSWRIELCASWSPALSSCSTTLFSDWDEPAGDLAASNFDVFVVPALSKISRTIR